MTLLRSPYNSNQLLIFPGGTQRSLLFKSQPATDDVVRSYSVAIGRVLPVSPDPTPAAVVGVWAVFTWGGNKGGVTEFVCDAQRGCRVQIEAASSLLVEIELDASGPFAAKGFQTQITISEDPISSRPNTFTDLGQSVNAVGAAFVEALPDYARVLTVLTDTPQSFPPAAQVHVGFWAVAADYPAGQAVGKFTVDNNGQRLPIPPQANFWTLELVGVGPLFAISQFELTF